MRQLLFPAAALALCGCATTTPDADNAAQLSASTPLTTTVETLQPVVGSTGRCETCQRHELLLDPTPPDDAPTTEVEPNGAAGQPRLHEEHAPFEGALPVPPKPPIDADPLDIAIWVGIASINYDPVHPFDPDALEQFIAPPLATELHHTASLTLSDSAPFGSRGVLLDAWLREPSTSEPLSDGVLMFERTTVRDDVDIVVIDFLAHETQDGWQIIEFQVSTT